MAKDDLNQRYRFAGDGLGVPGLPHEVSMQEAIELGVKELLEGAVKNGAYVAIRVIVETMKRASSAGALTLPSPEGRGEDKEK